MSTIQSRIYDYYTKLLKTSCINFDRVGINKAIKMGGDLRQGFIWACKGCHYQLVNELYVLHGKKFDDEGLKKACIKGSLAFFVLVMDKTIIGEKCFEDCLYYAHLGSNSEIITFLNRCGYYTCGKKGYMHAICKRGDINKFKKIYTAKSLSNANTIAAFTGACSGGHLEIVKLILSKKTSADLLLCRYGSYDHYEPYGRFISPSYIEYSLRKAGKYGYISVVDYIIANNSCYSHVLNCNMREKLMIDSYLSGNEIMYNYMCTKCITIHSDQSKIVCSYYGGNINIVKTIMYKFSQRMLHEGETDHDIISYIKTEIINASSISINTDVLCYLCDYFGCSLLDYQSLNNRRVDLNLYTTCVKYDRKLFDSDKMKQLVIDENPIYTMMIIGVDLPMDVLRFLNTFLY